MQSSKENNLLSLLYCRNCNEFFNSENNDNNVLKCPKCEKTVPVVSGIPRFVGYQNYTNSFGFQWNKYSNLQLDSYNHTSFSRDRLFTITGWNEKELDRKLVLDAGCGAGRFTEVLLDVSANVISVDMSLAVEACHTKMYGKANLVCQASILDLPFQPGTFDYVLCIGVIQHTPSPFDTISKLAQMVKPGGSIGLWIYELSWKSFIGTVGWKYLFRQFTKRINHIKLLKVIKKSVKLFWPLLNWARHKGKFGKILLRLLPFSSAYLVELNLSDDDFKNWVELDTFDMYSPQFDKPQRFEKVKKHLINLDFENIVRGKHGGISISAIKKR
ncbi:MAG: class I SAM-dependent methyltransferase [Ignavibacteriaceae bacterium]